MIDVIDVRLFSISLQAQRRRTILVKCECRWLGQGNGRHAHNYREVCQPHWQLRCRCSLSVLARRWKQPVYDDGRTSFPLRFHNHRAIVEPSTLAVHDVLQNATSLSRKLTKLPNKKPRRVGNGDEWVRSAGRSKYRWRHSRLCHGRFLLKHFDR